MKNNKLVEAQRKLGLDNKQLAKALRVNVRSVQRWRSGKAEVPGPVWAWMELKTK